MSASDFARHRVTPEPRCGDDARTVVRKPDLPAIALEFRQVSLAYDHTTVLAGVDGVVAAGEAIALVGPNGAGKSTVIKAALGLVSVTSGSITVLGRSPADARRDVAYVPQVDSVDADFPIRVRDVVLMGRYRRIGWLRWPGREDRAIVAGALEQVGLAERAKDQFGALSGGQRQRVLLARAIAARPALLLLDEPFNGIDAVSQQALLAALSQLKAAGTAAVISTHDLTIAHLACEETCLLNQRQFGFGPTRTTLTSQRIRETYGSQALALQGDRVVVTGA